MHTSHCNCYIFQGIAVYNDKLQINEILYAKIKEYKINKIFKKKKTTQFFLIIEGQMY